MAFATPFISDIALKVDQRDYFLLTLMGLLLVGSLSKGAFSKSVVAAFLGVIIGLIGIDPLSAVERFTFGALSLKSGVNIIVAILGLFGFTEILVQLSKSSNFQIVKQVGRVLPKKKTILKYIPLSLRVSIIGVFTGALPGAGGEIAALLGYDHAKRTVKNPSRPFGEGAYEGVVAPETANNSAIGGALIPMLTLGIPGDAVTAVIIGALVSHGLNPGPLLMVNSPDLFWVVTSSLLLANIFLLIFGLMGIGLFKKLVSIPKGILLPVIAVLTVIGAYAINNNVTDIYWMAAFGVLGYVLRSFGYPIAPLVLGLILGPLMDKSFRASMISAGNDIPTFLTGFVTSPVSIVLTLVLGGTLVLPMIRAKLGKSK